MSTTGEIEQLRASVTPSAPAPEGQPGERLEWQSELDSAMADLDSRLSDPRRRARDTAPQPMLPQLGQVEITSELLDEIAWRVSQQIRRTPDAVDAKVGTAATAAPLRVNAASLPEPEDLPRGIAISIRVRTPLFRWRFWRRSRRRHSMIALADHGMR
jgi:hypothetical protein